MIKYSSNSFVPNYSDLNTHKPLTFLVYLVCKLTYQTQGWGLFCPWGWIRITNQCPITLFEHLIKETTLMLVGTNFLEKERWLYDGDIYCKYCHQLMS